MAQCETCESWTFLFLSHIKIRPQHPSITSPSTSTITPCYFPTAQSQCSQSLLFQFNMRMLSTGAFKWKWRPAFIFRFLIDANQEGPLLYSLCALQGLLPLLRQQSDFLQRGQQKSTERNCCERARLRLTIIRIRSWIAAAE